MGRAESRLLALVLMTVVLGCGPAKTRPESIASTSYPGVPSGAPTPASPIRPGQAMGVLSGQTLALTILGSGSCPAVPVALDVKNADTLEVTFSTDYGRAAACTTNISPTTWVIDLPEAVGSSDSLTVHIRGDGVEQVDLPLRRS
jgi:hypothetical protein